MLGYHCNYVRDFRGSKLDTNFLAFVRSQGMQKILQKLILVLKCRVAGMTEVNMCEEQKLN